MIVFQKNFNVLFGSIENQAMKDLPLARVSSQLIDPSKIIAGAQLDLLWKVWRKCRVPVPKSSGPWVIVPK